MAQNAPDCLTFALPESVCRRLLPGRLRSADRHCPHPLPVHPVDQRQQLRVAHLDPAVANPRPAERCFLQPLGIKTQPGAVPPHDLDPVGPLGAKDIECAVERIRSGIAHQANQTVWTFSEVYRLAGQINLYTRRDHADRTVRITRRRWSSPISMPTRITISLTAISIIELARDVGAGTAASSSLSTSPLLIASARQPNNCEGEIPISRASADTLVPGSRLRATISALNSS